MRQLGQLWLMKSIGEELGVDVDDKIPVATTGQGRTEETLTSFQTGEAIVIVKGSGGLQRSWISAHN